MNRRPSQSRTGFDSFSPQHTAHFKAAQPGGEFFEPKPRASLGRRLLLALLLMTLIALAVNLAVNQFVQVARVTVPIRRMDPAFEGYTLLQISDLKGATYGSNQALIRFALQNEDFDAVVFTGDMVSSRGNAQPLYALIEMLREAGRADLHDSGRQGPSARLHELRHRRQPVRPVGARRQAARRAASQRARAD